MTDRERKQAVAAIREWDRIAASYETEGKLDEKGRPTVDRMPATYKLMQPVVKETEGLPKYGPAINKHLSGEMPGDQK